MKNVLGKLCGESRNIYFMFNNFLFFENLVFMRYVEKECRTVEAADDNVANTYCMLDN